MPLQPGELQLTQLRLGQPIEGKLLRPFAYETIGAVEFCTGAAGVAIAIYPNADDPDFKEPVVLLLTLENLDPFIRAIRIAEANIDPNMLSGGKG
jgi:hypothetical protein